MLKRWLIDIGIGLALYGGLMLLILFNAERSNGFLYALF
mgnify:CR=1 FL=1